MTLQVDLSGQLAVVTGASRGIGKAIALLLGRAGAKVVCVATAVGGSQATVQALQAAGGSGEAAACDISDETAVEALVKDVLERHGKVDILVNNAGITRDGLSMRMPTEDFDKVLSVNLRGAFLMCRGFARAMLRARRGRIINVGSIVGLTGNAGQANYAAAKAGLIGLTKSLAKELASRGVTANVVAPGFIDTDMTAGLPDEVRAGALRGIPAARFGQAEDVAGAVLFLASDLAAYVCGQVLVVDGGMAM